MTHKASDSEGRDAAYDMTDRYLRNNLDDNDYAEYSEALECVYQCPTEFEQWVERVAAAIPPVSEGDEKPCCGFPVGGPCPDCQMASGTPVGSQNGDAGTCGAGGADGN